MDISEAPADHPPFMDTHGYSGRLARSPYTFKERNNINSLQKKTFTKSWGAWPPGPPGYATAMGSRCLYLVSLSQPQPAVGTLIQALSLTFASACKKCVQCGMAKSIAVRLCTQSFPLLYTCLCVVSASSTLPWAIQCTRTTCQVFQARSWQQRRHSVDQHAETCIYGRPLRDAPIVCDGARSFQTREPTSEAVRPQPTLQRHRARSESGCD